MAQQEDEEQFRHIFFLIVAVQNFALFELGVNDSQLLVDSLKVPDVRDGYCKPPHPITFEHGWPHQEGHSIEGASRQGLKGFE